MSEKGEDMETGLPTAFTADDVAMSNPPPSYQEVMAAYETSLNRQTQELPTLAYIDIIPLCLSVGNIAEKIAPKFTAFSGIMDAANTWIKDNPSVVVWKCETVQRKVSRAQDGTLNFDLQNMLRHDATYGFQVYVRGVRLWLRPNPSRSATPKRLGLKNVLPAQRDVLIPARYHGFGGMMSMQTMNTAGETISTGVIGRKYQTFDGLSKTVEKMNADLQANPLPGRILNVETETIIAREGFSSDLDPESSIWTEEKGKSKRFTQVIRIYYELGSPAKEEIGLEEFQPELMSRGDTLKRPKFENMSNVIHRMSDWLPSAVDKGSRVVNIQQFDARVHRSFDGVEVGSDSTDEFDFMGMDVQMLKTIRVFTAKTSVHVSPAPPIPASLTSRLFLPEQINSRQCETMHQTMDRMDAWLKVTGLTMYSVETVEFIHSPNMKHVSMEDKPDYLQTRSGKHWVTGIRLYFPVAFTEPDPSLLPPPPSAGKTSSCVIV